MVEIYKCDMDNLSQTDMILSKLRFIPHKFHCDAWWNLWSSGSYGYFDSQQKLCCHRQYQQRRCHILAFIETNTIELGVQRFAVGANVIYLTDTDEVSLILWSTVSQNLRPLRAARSMWVYFTLCQQTTPSVKTQVASCFGGFGQIDGQR